MEELIFSYRASRTYRKVPGKPGTVRARSDQNSMNDGTVPAVSGLGHQVPVLPSVSLGTLSVDPEAVMSPGAVTGDMHSEMRQRSLFSPRWAHCFQNQFLVSDLSFSRR